MNNNEKKKAKYHLKLIVCGAGAVGKTSLVRRYVDDKFEFNYLLTVGMDPSNRLIELDDMLVDLLIYDVAGQKRFMTLRDIFFRNAHGALLVFDLTRSETLDELAEWKKQIDERSGNIPTILIGNKSDLDDKINIDYAVLEDDIIPEFKPIKYLETSALQDANVRDAFTLLSREILKQKGILKD